MQRPRLPLALPQLLLGLLALAIAVVWVAYVFAGTIHDAKHANDTIQVTGSARVPITSNLVQWTLTVEGSAADPAAAAEEQRRQSTEVIAFLSAAGIAGDSISPEVVRVEREVRRIDKTHAETTYHVYQGYDIS